MYKWFKRRKLLKEIYKLCEEIQGYEFNPRNCGKIASTPCMLYHAIKLYLEEKLSEKDKVLLEIAEYLEVLYYLAHILQHSDNFYITCEYNTVAKHVRKLCKEVMKK